jgi:hypothetical protein
MFSASTTRNCLASIGRTAAGISVAPECRRDETYGPPGAHGLARVVGLHPDLDGRRSIDAPTMVTAGDESPPVGDRRLVADLDVLRLVLRHVDCATTFDMSMTVSMAPAAAISPG